MNVPESTERIRFRPYTTDDLGNVVEMFSDSQARRFYPEMVEIASIELWIKWNLDNYREHGFGLWVIEGVETGRFLGDCGLSFQQVEGEEVLEIGYHLAEWARGNGLATEAGLQCLDYGFNVLGAGLICSLVHPENEASKGVAMRLHSQSRRYSKPDGTERLMFWTEAPSN